jgi:TM2 domain-containing membrane protein YozV
MARQWYVRVMGDVLGPLSDDQVHEMVLRKQLAPGDLVRIGEEGEWTTADKVKGLLDGSCLHKPRSDFSTPKSASIYPEAGQKRAPDVQVPRNSKLIPCPDCHNSVSRSAPRCPHCGKVLSKSRITAGLLTWFFGLAGIHKFYLGQNRQGLLYLASTLIIAPIPIVGILCIVDGFRYFSMSDDEFASFSNGSDQSQLSRTEFVKPLRMSKSAWFLIALFLFGAVSFIGIIVNPDARSTPSQSNSSLGASDENWKNSGDDTRGLSELQRLKIFHSIVLIQDRFPGDKQRQRPYIEQLFKPFNLELDYELKLLGEAIEKKWPLPPQK